MRGNILWCPALDRLGKMDISIGVADGNELNECVSDTYYVATET